MKRLLTSLTLALGLSAVSGIQADNYFNDGCNQATFCPESCGWGKFTVGADWLYWRTDVSGTSYGTDVTVVDAGAEFASKILKPNFKYENGYRVFADYLTLDNQWKFCAAYTHAPSKGSNSFSSDIFTNFATLDASGFSPFNPFIGTTFNSLNSRFNSSVNYFDFDISRSFAICSNFEIIPHIGMRVLWMNQKLNINGTSPQEIGPDVILNTQLRSKLNGVGLGGGLAGTWQFYEGFSLIGNVGGTVLYSHFKNRGSLAAGTVLPAGFNTSYRDSSYRGIPTFDSFIGVQYASCVYGYDALIHVGWEQHIIYQSTDFLLSNSGNTTLQGLTLGAAVAF